MLVHLANEHELIVYLQLVRRCMDWYVHSIDRFALLIDESTETIPIHSRTICSGACYCLASKYSANETDEQRSPMLYIIILCSASFHSPQLKQFAQPLRARASAVAKCESIGELTQANGAEL